LTGLFWAIAGIGRFAASAAPAAPVSNVRRPTLETIGLSSRPTYLRGAR
jgi:hypothetical protein